jgi:hypothetical protein
MFGVGGGRLGRRVGMGGVLILRRCFCEQLGKKNPFDGCATMKIHASLPSGLSRTFMCRLNDPGSADRLNGPLQLVQAQEAR